MEGFLIIRNKRNNGLKLTVKETISIDEIIKKACYNIETFMNDDFEEAYFTELIEDNNQSFVVNYDLTKDILATIYEKYRKWSGGKC